MMAWRRWRYLAVASVATAACAPEPRAKEPPPPDLVVIPLAHAGQGPALGQSTLPAKQLAPPREADGGDDGDPAPLAEATPGVLGPPPASSSVSVPFDAAAPPGTQPVDRAAISYAFSRVHPGTCAEPGGPGGPGHVTIGFDPSGFVTSVVLDGGPFPGTSVGQCLVDRFRAMRIPPFDPAHPLRVGKSFTVGP